MQKNSVGQVGNVTWLVVRLELNVCVCVCRGVCLPGCRHVRIV